MALQASLADATDDAQRPSSVRTNDSSTFADSAISIGSSTPKYIDDHEANMNPSQTSESSLSDRLNQLAASAWASEQEGSLSQRQQDKIGKALRTIEDCLEDRDEDEEVEEKKVAAQMAGSVDENQLQEVRQRLSTTVAQMRLRQQEQRHLHQLSVQKLEAVAQTCLKQDQQLKEMSEEAQNLLKENRKLVTENGWMQDHVSRLESDATQKDVAVDAMSSAVAGLEGWISSSPGGFQSPSRRRGKYVMRGRGRFRNRYWVEDPEDDEPNQQVPEPSMETRELQDGVKAWVRGFRDVEEELKRVTPKKPRAPLKDQASALADSEQLSLDELPSSEDDEWGDFETVSAAQLTT